MKFKITSNPRKEWTEGLAQDVEMFLTENGHQAATENADATICIGGDGTVLYAHHQRELQGTVLGIGTRKSYICQLTRDDWKERILGILQSEPFYAMTLKAEVDGRELIAFNDFVVHAKDYRVITMEVTHSGQTSQFRGDGIIISSSIGSPAYAYSAGGEQFPPDERKILVVPIAPYRRAFLPQTLAENAEIIVTAKEDFAFIIDGVFISEPAGSTKVNVQKGVDIKLFHGVGFHE